MPKFAKDVSLFIACLLSFPYYHSGFASVAVRQQLVCQRVKKVDSPMSNVSSATLITMSVR